MARRWFKIGTGKAIGVTTILTLFALLSSLYGFEINDLTGDIVCEGTYENPCISKFEVRNPNAFDVDIYSADQVKLEFSPDIKDYALFVPDGRCSATGKCACEMKNGEKLGFKGLRCVDFTNKTKPRQDKVYNFRFSRYSTDEFTLAGIKNNPKDEIKWTFGTNDVELDPIWLSKVEDDLINTEKFNVTYNGVSIPLEDYLNVYEDNGKIKFKTLDNKTCSLELEYEKENVLDISNQKIDIIKKSGGYYFTTDVGVEVKSMSYKMNCSGFETRFEDNKFLMDNIKIDFNEAKDKQNISTIYDTETQRLIFLPDKDEFGKDKKADLRMIDPDITVDGSVHVVLYNKNQPRSLVWVNPTTGYIFFSDSGNDLHYRKTTNSGTSWATERTIKTGDLSKFAIWYDKWTDGDTGDVIHIFYGDTGEDNLYYNSFSTSDDTLDGEVTVLAGVSIISSDWTASSLSITKSRGGNIYVGGWGDNDGERGFWRATDSPAISFSSRADVTDGTTVDRIMFLAGNEADSNDIWSIYQDVSADEITLKVYDNSENSWSESAAIDTIVEHVERFGFDSMDRHSDGHAILVMWNDDTNANADLVIHNITDASTFSEVADIVTNDNAYGISGLLINQQNDDLYVAYQTATTTGHIVYQLSQDNGTTWDGETAMSVTNDDHRVVIGGTSIQDDGGRWMPIWYNDDLDDLKTNSDNSIEISGPVGASCTYTSGDWNIEASDNCVISENIVIDGSNVLCTGTGTFTIQDTFQVSGFGRRQFSKGCYYQSFGSGGFFQ